MFSTTDTHFQIMAFFRILLNRKHKRCVLGQKSKFEKKNFFRRLWAATAGLQYWQNPKIRHAFWAQITSKYSQYGIFSEQLKALGMLNLPDFQFDAQEAKWQLTLALGRPTFFSNFDFWPKTHLFCFLFNKIGKNAIFWKWVSVAENTCLKEIIN